MRTCGNLRAASRHCDDCGAGCEGHCRGQRAPAGVECGLQGFPVSLRPLFRPRFPGRPCRRNTPMALDLVPTGRDVPNEINVVIEIPKDADPVKYEVDKATGAIFVDRILSTPMRYPCNYGYVPHTLCGDGD